MSIPTGVSKFCMSLNRAIISHYVSSETRSETIEPEAEYSLHTRGLQLAG